jgi:hypothetical protein
MTKKELDKLIEDEVAKVSRETVREPQIQRPQPKRIIHKPVPFLFRFIPFTPDSCL